MPKKNGFSRVNFTEAAMNCQSCQSSSRPGSCFYIPHPPPDGAQAGWSKPPEPVGIPLGLTAPADISFSTDALLHLGQTGFGSSDERKSSSNSWQHLLQENSYMGKTNSL